MWYNAINNLDNMMKGFSQIKSTLVGVIGGVLVLLTVFDYLPKDQLGIAEEAVENVIAGLLSLYLIFVARD